MERINRRVGWRMVVGVISPVMGFELNTEENEGIFRSDSYRRPQQDFTVAKVEDSGLWPLVMDLPQGSPSLRHENPHSTQTTH